MGVLDRLVRSEILFFVQNLEPNANTRTATRLPDDTIDGDVKLSVKAAQSVGALNLNLVLAWLIPQYEVASTTQPTINVRACHAA